MKDCAPPGLALQLAQLLGGPGGQCLGLVGLGAAALCQQVVDKWTHLHQLGHILAKRRAQITAHTHTLSASLLVASITMLSIRFD